MNIGDIMEFVKHEWTPRIYIFESFPLIHYWRRLWRRHMSGNKITVRTLDLDCDFLEIKAQLDAIVKEHFE